MALRVRKNGRILCAAKSEPMNGDMYVDDAVHAWLTRCMPISINVIDSLGEDENGEEEWAVIKKIENEKCGICQPTVDYRTQATIDYKAEYNKLLEKYNKMSIENGQLIGTIINIVSKL